MTALENVLVGQHQHLETSWIQSVFRTRAMRREEVDAIREGHRLLEYVGLNASGDLLASNLPYGDQRRLEIARGLATQPRLLLLDEPTAGMNPAETVEMTGLIRRLRDDLGITILLIEHEMRVVMGISERITVLDYGKRIAEGTPDEIQRDARVIEAYLGKKHAKEVMEDAGIEPVDTGVEAADELVTVPAAGTASDGDAPPSGERT
jgi:branched-chain amino acid transport system ATP-binding protein